MTEEDFANIIRLARRSPLAHMDEAEAAAQLLQKFAAFVLQYQKDKEERRANGHDTDEESGHEESAAGH